VRLSGTIVRLQVQESSLKVGLKPRVYDPAPIHSVSALRLTPSGVVGLMDDGRPILDVHHQSHPTSKNRDGLNDVSIGFTSHYAAMRERFGGHLSDGIAGENILIELADADRVVRDDDLIDGVVIAGQDRRQLTLTSIDVAAPCVEFARFALRFPDDARPNAAVTEALRFLDAGVRGFYASYAGEPAEVRIGDRVMLL
jgi:hypothetical protein